MDVVYVRPQFHECHDGIGMAQLQAIMVPSSKPSPARASERQEALDVRRSPLTNAGSPKPEAGTPTVAATQLLLKGQVM